METKKKPLMEKSDLDRVSSVIKALAEKYGCTRQYVRLVIRRGGSRNSVNAQKILADVRDISEVLGRDTTITI